MGRKKRAATQGSFQAGHQPWNKGHTAPEETRQRMSQAHTQEPVEAFWARVGERVPIGCWLWQGTIMTNGYGFFRAAGHGYLAHRFAYSLLVGEIAPRLQIDHLCRNRSCVNPAHLRLVSLKENVLAGVGRSAVNARKTECTKGHPLSGDNLYINPRGQRCCRECYRENWRRYSERKKAKQRDNPTTS